MGFGILLFGYFTAFAFELINTYFFADIIGGLVMLYALGKLSEYNGKFKAAAYGDMVFCAVAAFRAVMTTFRIIPENGLTFRLLTVFYTVTVIIFHFLLNTAVVAMAVDAEDEKILGRARFNRVFVTVSYGFMIVSTVISDRLPQDRLRYVSGSVLLIVAVSVLLMSVLLYSSFVTFMVVGGETQEPAESKIPLVNKLRRRSYEKKKKIHEENTSMYLDYLDKKEGRNKAPKKKKKR